MYITIIDDNTKIYTNATNTTSYIVYNCKAIKSTSSSEGTSYQLALYVIGLLKINNVTNDNLTITKAV